MMRRLWIIVLALALLPAAARAQDQQWQERTTTYMAVLYPAGSEVEAERYAAFVDRIYDEVTGELVYKPAPPLTLRIYPTMELYQRINPLARTNEGVVAHAHTGRREISIALPQTSGLSEEEIRNNVRHELTHIIAAELSDGQLSVMWQEGIAQSMEQSAPQLEIKVSLLQQAVDSGALASWRQLDAPGVMYGNPALGYPQSWSMVSFLLQRDGMPAFIQFMQATRTSGGYRTALQQSYGVSADDLEREWRAQLDGWLAGGWRVQPGLGIDPASIQAALDSGRYPEALTAAEAALLAAPDPALETLRDLAAQGVEADAALLATRTALGEGDYAEAASQSAAARRLYASLERADVLALIDEYDSRVRDGQQAYALLGLARADMGSLRLSAARSSLEDAALIFARLGDQRGRAAAEDILDTLNRRIRIAAAVLLALVVLGLAWNIDRRRAARRRALPF